MYDASVVPLLGDVLNFEIDDHDDVELDLTRSRVIQYEQKRIEWKSRKLFDIQQLATDLLPYELTLESRCVDEVSGSESILETDVVRNLGGS